MERTKLDTAKKYITTQWNSWGDSPWLEGWICGFVYGDGDEEDEQIDELMGHLQKLRLASMIDEMSHEDRAKFIRLIKNRD